MSEAELPIPKARRRSVSQLMSYSNCSEAYRLERRTDAPQRPAGWMYQGTAVHDAIEIWEGSGRTLTEEELNLKYLTAYRTLVNDALEEFDNNLGAFMTGGFKKAQDDLTDRENVGWYQVQDYVQEALKSHDVWEVVESEKEFNILINGIWLNGFIDQVWRDKITGELTSVDLKSGAKVPAAPVQLAIYNYALGVMYPDDTIADEAYWMHLGRPASKTGKTKSKPSRWVAEDLSDWPVERIATWLHDMDQAELQGIYLPSPTDGCERVCGVASWCRAKGKHLPSIQQYAPEGAFDKAIVEVAPMPDQTTE